MIAYRKRLVIFMLINNVTESQKQALDSVMNGRNVFITGGAGTGKTYLLHLIVEALQRQRRQVVTCSFTNMAALMAKGSTIHRVFGFPVGPCISPKRKQIITRTNKVLSATDVVIIDEISMVRIDMMDAIVASLRKIEQEQQKKIQIVLIGDFFQLPPVIDEETNERYVLESYYKNDIGNGYAFLAPGWKQCNFQTVVLRETKRQSNDNVIDALNQLRKGSTKCIDYFNKETAQKKQDGIYLYPYNKSVRNYNQIALKKLPGEEMVIRPVIKGNIQKQGGEEFMEELHLKKGAKVIITKNETIYSRAEHVCGPNFNKCWLKTKKLVNYHNGSTGTVVDIYIDEHDSLQDYVVVQVDEGDLVMFSRAEYNVYTYDVGPGNIVRQHVEYVCYQFPIQLGYAMSIHKSQGQTYDSLNIDPECWGVGQLYVALSRIRDISKLHLIHKIRRGNVICDPIVNKFYDWIERGGRPENYPFCIEPKVEDEEEGNKCPMSKENIIDINEKRNERKGYMFKSVPVQLTIDGSLVKYPCIGLYCIETGIAISHPGFERWYLSLREVSMKKSETMRKRAHHICCFMNYILWNTRINMLEELTIDDVRGFLVDFRTTVDGDDRDPSEWARGIYDVYRFLLEYITYNESHRFGLKKEDIYMVEKVINRRSKRNDILTNYNKLGVKPPKKSKKKNRFLLESYMEILIFDAIKYDPMVAFGMALQAYSGLREGEIVNLTRNSIELIYGGFGRISRINIDINDEAPFVKEQTRKSQFGNIKVYRTAKVYPDFNDEVLRMYGRHEDLLDSLGVDRGAAMPLFVDKWGHPMSVDTYKGRVKKMFYEHFLPDLKKLCISENAWAENAPYIEAYEKEYPGAHMFRHWFTMYLVKHIQITRNQDIVDIVADWRGDSNRESMEEYLHMNADIVAIYKSVAKSFQRSLLEEIL